MDMKNFGYLERGTLIQVGTLLRTEAGLREVVEFVPSALAIHFGRASFNFIVRTSLWGDGEAKTYSKQDLEEMLEEKSLKIYNES